MDCDVGIVGGGLAGLYMAESLLRHKKETKVCVFERDTRLGGRIYDYVFPQVPDESVGWWNNSFYYYIAGVFFRYRMTSNNETVSRQMPRAGNIAKL